MNCNFEDKSRETDELRLFFAAERVRLIASTINWRLSHQRFYALVYIHMAGCQFVVMRIFLSLLPDHVHLLIDGLKFPAHPVRKALRWSRHLERIKIEAIAMF